MGGRGAVGCTEVGGARGVAGERPSTGGGVCQAAMGMVVVAAEVRAGAGEDLAILSKRVADDEAWSGQTAGR